MSGGGSQSGAGAHRVLLIDDERELVASLERGLKAEGFSVNVAFDGDDGLELSRQTRWDVIVCDIMLPRLNGYRLCSALRAEGVWTPMLMLTAKSGDLDEAEGLDSGADDWLTKPFSFVVLVARIRALTRRGARNHDGCVTADDLVIDPARQRCRRAGIEIDLTRRELSLAQLLVRRSGQVVSNREILAELWEPSYQGDPNIVEVYIGRLRRKLDVPFGRNTIRTVRGTGYQFLSE